MSEPALKNLMTKYRNLCNRGGTFDEWKELGNEFLQAGDANSAKACYEKAFDSLKVTA